MRKALAALTVIGVLCCGGAAGAQGSNPQGSGGQGNGAPVSGAPVSGAINYDLFPGFGGKRGYPPIANYFAWAISFKDNKYYVCIASYKLIATTTPTLNCALGGTFDPPLLSGGSVKTLQARGGPRGGPNTDEARSAFFWQIDQASGKVQFCMPIAGANCVAFQLP